MQEQYPYPEEDAVRSLVSCVVLTLVTCGIYGLYWRAKQMATLNAWLKREEYSFWKWFFASIFTCGIYAVYNDYEMGNGINEIRSNNGMYIDSCLPVVCVFLAAVFSFGIGSLLIQQSWINKTYRGI